MNQNKKQLCNNQTSTYVWRKFCLKHFCIGVIQTK